MTRLLQLLGCFLLLVSGLALPRFAHADTYSQAMAKCQANAATWDDEATYPKAYFSRPPQCALDGHYDAQTISSYVVCKSGACAGQNFYIGGYPFTGASCVAGTVVPSGSNYNQYESSGELCQGSCEMALSAGTYNKATGWSGGGDYVLTGAMCSGTGSSKSGLSAPPSETVNADGSKTLCDPISGKCVTTKAAATSPASSSSTGNHSTDSSSVTNNPASSSSTTTTTTTTGTNGSGDTGTSGGSSTSVSSSKTDTPASSSSTASKCTTGVCDVGNADGDPGGLYNAGTDTPGSVYSSFIAQVSNSPIVAATTGFFTVSLSGTSCPTWTLPGNQYWGPSGLTFTSFCDPNFLSMLTMAGYIVLGVAAFCAFRIAIY